MPRLDELGDPRPGGGPVVRHGGNRVSPVNPLPLRGNAYRTDAGKARIGVDELGDRLVARWVARLQNGLEAVREPRRER